MKTAAIYEILNTVTNDRYVGSSKNIERRWGVHKFLLNNNIHHNTYLQNAWNKYGSISFTFQIVETVKDIECLIEREQYYLDNIKTKYNIRTIAERNIGIPISEETKRKISDKQKGKIPSIETRKKMSESRRRYIQNGGRNYFLGKRHTEETKEKMRLSWKGRFGHKQTEETKRKISETKRCRRKEREPYVKDESSEHK